MSNDVITLTEAIKANENGLDSLRCQRDEHRRLEVRHKQQGDVIQREIEKRQAMTVAMKELQAVLPGDETIKFLIPRK